MAYKVNLAVVLVCVVLVVVALYVLTTFNANRSDSEGFNRYNDPAYKNMCEFQPACMWDTARWVQLSNGMEGNCTLHGLACPAFSKDHDRARNSGLSPTMVSDRYMQNLW